MWKALLRHFRRSRVLRDTLYNVTPSETPLLLRLRKESMTDAEKKARADCRAWLVSEGEAMFRDGTLQPDQVFQAAAATMRAVEKNWRRFLPDGDLARP